MASIDPSNGASSANESENGSDDSTESRSPSPLPEALALGREKRATAGNKLRALLDAEFQEEEIFKEDENDEEFIRQKSDEAEEFLSDSENSDEGEAQDDEEAGERELIAQQKAEKQRKRKAPTSFVKPVPKRKPPVQKVQRGKENVVAGGGILASKTPGSSASSISNRRISFDPSLHGARRSSRALTVQTTNETHSRIISAAARRATMPAVQRREQTPPLTQEERLIQAKLTEEENKRSLKRIVEAEEERARKRKEKLDALRRRWFNEPIIRFISRRRNLIEEVKGKEEAEEEIVVVDGHTAPELGEIKVEEEMKGNEAAINGAQQENITELGQESVKGPEESENMIIDQVSDDMGQRKEENPADRPSESEKHSEIPGQEGESKSLTETVAPSVEVISTPINMEMGSTQAANAQSANKDVASDKIDDIPLSQNPDTKQTTRVSNLAEPIENDIGKPVLPTDASTTDVVDAEVVPTVLKSPSPPVPKTPPPYHDANFTANTISLIPLPNAPIPTAREAFFPSVPLIAPPKPKSIHRCPITGLQARYKDPFTGVGYYDIHAFKILREVARKGGRYVWCSEGGWFVGETGWGGRGAKGVPEGWIG